MYQKNIHYSPGLERAILGATMIEKSAFGRIFGSIDKDCFYHVGHQIVFESIEFMYKNGMPIDFLTVTDYVMRVKNIRAIDDDNSDYFIAKLTNDVVGTGHLEYHTHIVKTLWMERQLIRLTHGGGKLEGPVRSQIYEIQKKLQALQEKTTEHDWVDMTQMMVDLYRHQEEMRKTGGIGMPTGFSMLDRENGGFHPGQLVVIGARPSVGKSALLGSIAMGMAVKGKTVGIVSLEMSNVEIAARLAALDTNTDFNVLFRGLYRDVDETDKVYQRIGEHTSTLPIYVSDKTKVSVPEIRSKAEKLKQLHGLDCLMIDYLQLVNVSDTYSKNRNRENEIAEMSRGCKIMAKEMGVPVVLLCQLNREVTKRKGEERYPQLSDLRESGAIEQDADVVMFLHRDFMAGFQTDEQGNSTERQGDLVVRKWRNGKNNFIIPMDFDGPKMKFSERRDGAHQIINYPVQSKKFYEKDDDTPF